MFDGYCSTAKEGMVRKAHILAYGEGTAKDAVKLEYSHGSTEDMVEYISASTLLQRIVEGRIWHITA